MLDEFIESGMVIKHKQAKDVCFLVGSVNGPWVYGQWVNLGFSKSWLIDLFQGIRPEISDWQVMSTFSDKCFRNNTWKDIV